MLEKDRHRGTLAKQILEKHGDIEITTHNPGENSYFQGWPVQNFQMMTFKEADSAGDYLSVATGAVLNVGGSVVYNLGTGGSGFFMQFASENFITANEEKAKANNTTINDLLKSGDHDVEAPIKIAAFQAGLELFSFSKIISKTVQSSGRGVVMVRVYVRLLHCNDFEPRTLQI